ADLFLIKRTRASAKYWFGAEADPPPKVDQFIQEDDLIKFGKEKLKVLETPGHSPGGVAFLGRGVVFAGDTLFYQGVGRTDFSYASEADLVNSIKNKLFKLPDEIVVYPGHGEETTIGEEKKNFEEVDKRQGMF
ncbi:MAG: metallo-beta-lactamase family protein, partial [Microgenomates group bacterium LiPW_31]